MASSSITVFLIVCLTLPVASAAPVDFNQEIRPILSNTCFRCHGPDEAERKAGLRLDTSAGAQEDLGGYAAIVPGKPEASVLLSRVTSHDPDEVMPPAKAGDRLSDSDVALLEKWIAEGAPYAEHWAYVPPRRVTPPAADDVSWARQDLDRFIHYRLQTEGLSPSPEADRHVLARRVALDLTGLPPSPEELRDFVRSERPDVYEQFVDGLLAKDTFGEHWARHWLDLARYADSAGYADDPPRTIWAFRDYVIRSFNANKPFDQFTREQLAGDLLPQPTDEQLIATAFHRNTQTNNEGGTNDEEFRNVAVVDRVNTTFAVWMGTTMACAQCHTHKYDPITQKEYFEVFAILNNTADADRRDESPTLEVSTEAFRQRKAEKQHELDVAQRVLSEPDTTTKAAFERWQAAALTRKVDWQVLNPAEREAKSGRALTVGEDGVISAAPENAAAQDVYHLTASVSPEALITALRLEVHPEGRNVVLSELTVANSSEVVEPIRGRFVRIDLAGRGKMIHLAEVQAFSGGENVALRGQASQSSNYADATADRAIDGRTEGNYNKRSVSHTAANGKDPWWEVDLGETHHLERLVIWNRTDGQLASRLDGFKLSVLDEERNALWSETYAKAPEVDLPVALDGSRQVPLAEASAGFSQERFDVSQAIDGKVDGRSGWALAPRLNEPHAAVFAFARPVKASQLTIELSQQYPNHALRRFRLAVTTDQSPGREIPAAIKEILVKESGKRSRREAKRLYQYFAKYEPSLEAKRDKLAGLRRELEEMKPPTTVPIMRELEGGKRRETRIQLRGNYLDKGDAVEAGLPDKLHESPSGPLDRLALANWLMDPENPLTARVTANRFWEAIFGIGLVRTSEEFGSQGEPPSHPALLDYLALELVENGWDVKGFLKMLVTSATYRQSSRVTPALLERDPDNRLLARGPRFRLSAEMIRDQALYVSGLLSAKMYGAPVKPLQPSIGLSAAFGGGIDWKTSQGEDRYRRGLYTTWRRSNPYPSMAAFDAPNREVCTVRRDRTNTPLQALVTLNDPVYMEAAQALARNLVALNKATPEETVDAAFWHCLSRPAREEERRALTALFESTRASLAKAPERAKDLATNPLGPVESDDADLAALAAWSVVGNVILNLDEVFLKP